MLGSEPVFIGHSLGGLIVQKYLENRRAPAGVLLASYPPQWARRMAVALRAALRHPSRTIRANTVGTLADLVNIPRLARESLFCENTPQGTVECCAGRMQPESKRAGAIFVRVRPSRLTIPVLVLDGEHDAVLNRK
jgi:alpha-beta hydrolase superfamily lysophospholipase